jgi:cysteinyl-tRNA synthetase
MTDGHATCSLRRDGELRRMTRLMKTRNSCCHVGLGVLLFVAVGGCTGPDSGDRDGEGGVEPHEAITATSPTDGASEVATDAVIAITFVGAADPDSVDVWLEPDAGDFMETWSERNTVLTVTLEEPFESDTEYVVFIGELTFEDGSLLVDEFSFRFSTADVTDGGGDGGAPTALPLDEIRFWGYQIQAIDSDGAIDALAASRYDMLVLEPTRTDAELLSFDTEGMVERLKATKAHDGVHRKLIIAYVDIGEAEDWRWYWTWSKEAEEAQIPEDVDLPADWPAYIVARDPDGWVGNYPVAYWDPEWKDIMIYGENRGATDARDYTSSIDELILDGFDGIYLDWVEGFENVHIIAAAEAEGLDPQQEMIAFITEIRAYARQRDPDFLVIQQNAAALVEGHSELLDHIDAIAQEGVWYDGVAGDDWDDIDGYFFNEQDLTDEYLGFLDQYLAADVPVFACEYALEENAADAYRRAGAEGYVPYVTRRSLGRLTDTPPPGY